ncbi:hypothetical protein R1sor_009721 [Riccia sorocarpa]|uniref:Phosphatidic acid phosphatase type 2/haloperoxidase domain-containing protein n=1 Tax=Riccia sorocarpa TaxID=122646 RepID=A0ABD3HZX2_9MARC
MDAGKERADVVTSAEDLIRTDYVDWRHLRRSWGGQTDVLEGVESAMEGKLPAMNSSLAGDVLILPSFPMWQLLVILGMITWIYLARISMITLRVRSILQPFVSKHVENSVPFIVWLQGSQSQLLDAVLASLSYCVSVEFYTAFLPLLFWSGHSRLARNMTLLMALCIYLGNIVKDVVSAPRPPTPPVRKLLAATFEKDVAQEYGLPSSHTINTICLSGYLLHYIGSHGGEANRTLFWVSASVLVLVITGVVYGRMYLGMHSPLDLLAGGIMSLGILSFWLIVEEYVETFVAYGENVTSFWATIAVLLLFAYPSGEHRTPSFEFHTAFNGVALGVVCGVHRTFHLYHDGRVKLLSLTSAPGAAALLLRLLVGLPVCLAVKGASKALAIRILPSLCSLLGVEIQSSGCVQAAHVQEMAVKLKKNNLERTSKKAGFLPRVLQILEDEVLDVDTGIRFIQYAGLGWSVVELAPSIYRSLNL